MDHVVIMKKSWGLIPKIRTGEKTIESRWYKTRRIPWNKIRKDDSVYFKNSGEPVTIKAKVSKVVQYYFSHPERTKRAEGSHSPISTSSQCNSTLSPKDILDKYGKKLGIRDVEWFYEQVKNKRYCILVFLSNPVEVGPFNINKSGFGLMSAWISLEEINTIKKPLL